MVSQANEQALEASFERALAGFNREQLDDLKAQGAAEDKVALAAAEYRVDEVPGYELGWSALHCPIITK